MRFLLLAFFTQLFVVHVGVIADNFENTKSWMNEFFEFIVIVNTVPARRHLVERFVRDILQVEYVQIAGRKAKGGDKDALVLQLPKANTTADSVQKIGLQLFQNLQTAGHEDSALVPSVVIFESFLSTPLTTSTTELSRANEPDENEDKHIFQAHIEALQYAVDRLSSNGSSNPRILILADNAVYPNEENDDSINAARAVAHEEDQVKFDEINSKTLQENIVWEDHTASFQDLKTQQVFAFYHFRNPFISPDYLVWFRDRVQLIMGKISNNSKYPKEVLNLGRCFDYCKADIIHLSEPAERNSTLDYSKINPPICSLAYSITLDVAREKILPSAMKTNKTTETTPKVNTIDAFLQPFFDYSVSPKLFSARRYNGPGSSRKVGNRIWQEFGVPVAGEPSLRKSAEKKSKAKKSSVVIVKNGDINVTETSEIQTALSAQKQKSLEGFTHRFQPHFIGGEGGMSVREQELLIRLYSGVDFIGDDVLLDSDSSPILYHNRTTAVFEWGMGTSTAIAIYLNVLHIF